MDAAARRAILVAEVQDLSAQLELDGLTVLGSKGQSVAHWALSQRRAALVEIRHLDASTPPAPASDPLADFLAAQ